MISHGSWKVGPFYEVLGDQLGVVELPAGTHQGCQINGLGYSISKGTKNFDAAWEFVQFLASKEGQAATCEVVIPAYEGAADAWLESYPTLDLQVFMDATEYGYPELALKKETRKIKQVFSDHVAEAR
jgi:multiple sugar transport system substrate-binding protein